MNWKAKSCNTSSGCTCSAEIDNLQQQIDSIQDTDSQTLSTTTNPDGSTATVAISNGNSVPIVHPPSPVTPTITVDRVTKTVGFAAAQVIQTGSTTNNPTITVPYSTNITSVVASGNANDTRRFTVTFATPHPNGANYAVKLSKASDEPNGDERKIQWKEGTKTPTSVVVELSIDDNGGTEDQNVFSTFDITIFEELEFIQNIYIDGVPAQNN